MNKAGLEKEAGLEEMVRDTSAQEDVTTDNDTGQDLREPKKKESAMEEGDETKDEAPDELLKDATADDASDHYLKGLAKEAGLEEGDETEENIPEEMLRDEISTSSQMRTVKVGYDGGAAWMTAVHNLELRMAWTLAARPQTALELPRTCPRADFGLPARCPGPATSDKGHGHVM